MLKTGDLVKVIKTNSVMDLHGGTEQIGVVVEANKNDTESCVHLVSVNGKKLLLVKSQMEVVSACLR
jgi:hypothetical protein